MDHRFLKQRSSPSIKNNDGLRSTISYSVITPGNLPDLLSHLHQLQRRSTPMPDIHWLPPSLMVPPQGVLTRK